MIKVKAGNKEELIKEAARLSKETPRKYIIAYTIFNEAYCDILSRLSYKTVDRTKLGGYFINGEFKLFSQKLITEYQNKGICDD
jgi:hypothetical protein